VALGLAACECVDAEFFYGAYWSKEVRAAPLPTAASMLPWLRRNVPFSYELRQMVQEHRFTTHARAGRFGIYHEPNILPLPFDGPTVVTVHDLSWIRFPHTHPIERVRAMDKYFEPGLQRASLILTDSEFVKRELMEVFGVKSERILPVALGVEPSFHPRSPEETQAVLHRHSLMHGQYLLAVGTLEPRKNLQVALQAFMQLPPAMRKQYPLVLVGMTGWHTSALEAQMAPLIRSGEVRQLGYVSRTDLATVMAGALALIYPSIYEGFGLPPLEAMACGVPVIASNVSSLPEVVGETGLLIDPQDASSVARAMELLITDDTLRGKLAAKALTRSQEFTWTRCVAQTVGAYRQVLNQTN
jgi:alpha-1,3-rhamnosyl/mannosyltransferase